MSEMRNPKYQEKIVRKIKTIEDAIGDLTDNEMSAVVCSAITGVLIRKEHSSLEIKQFYTEMAVNAINHTEISMMIYKMRFKDDEY